MSEYTEAGSDFVAGESNARAVAAVWLTTLTPATARVGDASFTLHCLGDGFGADAVISWNGADEPTTVVSPTEVTTAVNMLTATTPMPIPVLVRSRNGYSESRTFDLAPTLRAR